MTLISSGSTRASRSPSAAAAATRSCPTGSPSTGSRSRSSFPDPKVLEEEIRITVLHELAHYFGMDEDRIAELGYD